MRKFKALIIMLLLSVSIFSYELTPNNFDRVINSNKVVLVKFWAPWCGPCSMLAPEFEKAKRVVGKKALLATYNVDLRGEPLSRYNIQVIPTMVLFVDGKEVDRSNSILNYKDIAEWVLGYVPQ